MMKAYLQTPPGIMQILSLFTEHKLSYILFKCEHIFAGQNKNLDILFETNTDYSYAGKLLQEQGFVIRLSEKIEKYKTMYCGFIDGTMYSIHLHREIAWHGMIALDKRPVFERAQHLNQSIIIPSAEDSILIHAAHVLFENFEVKEREKNYFLKLDSSSPEPPLNQALNREYINWQIRKNHWEKGFWEVIRTEQLSKVQIGKRWIQKIWKEPVTAVYLFLKALRVPLRKISLRRKGCLIALLGVNGSGKSTLAKKTLELYHPITQHLGIRKKYYYFGWKPAFPLTKVLSFVLQKTSKKIFYDLNLKKPEVPSFSLKQELLFMYLFGEFLFRYYWELYPALRKGELVISDRYYYDMFGQYPYARNSKFVPLLLRLFPRPDFTYLLQSNIEEILHRKKTDIHKEKIEQAERKVLPPFYLRQQMENYAALQKIVASKTVNTEQNIEFCASQILSETRGKVINSN